MSIGVGLAPTARNVIEKTSPDGVLIFRPLRSSTFLIGRLLLVMCRKPFEPQPSTSTPFSADFSARYVPSSESIMQNAWVAVLAANGNVAALNSGTRRS